MKKPLHCKGLGSSTPRGVEPDSASGSSANDLRQSPDSSGAPGGAPDAESVQTDVDIQAVVEGLKALCPEARQEVLRIVGEGRK